MGVEYFKVEVIHRETVTPSSPTPLHLRNLSLSIFDQFPPEVYIPILLVYPNADGIDPNSSSLAENSSSLLKASLSETLTHFYPFAGRFLFNDSIFCNDHGAAFIETRVNCPLSRVLENPDPEMLEPLFPAAYNSTQEVNGHLLLVQVSFCECGGMAIGVSISHKVADAFTYSTFLKTWAAVAFGFSSSTNHQVQLPTEFGPAASLFPPQNLFNSPEHVLEFAQERTCTTRRFVFDASSIAALKLKAASASVPNLTRVEVVSALIWKCVMEASRSNVGFVRPSVWCSAVNMRKASTENLMGNHLWYFAAITDESEVDIQSLAAKLRKSKEDYKVMYPNGVTAEQAYKSLKASGNFLATKSMDIYNCSSWCWLPFYETNFGRGKPSWVGISSTELKNTIIFMDVNDVGNGIQVYLTLLDEDMAIVEQNKELLAYASLNPSVM